MPGCIYQLLEYIQPVGQKPFFVQYAVFLALFLSVLLFGIYGIGFDSAGFIYNQF